MPLIFGTSLVQRARHNTSLAGSAYFGEIPILADIEADYLNVQPPRELRAAWTSASSGDNRLVQVSNGDDGRSYARMKAGELPIEGAQRVANLLPDLNLAGWSVTKTGGDAVTPTLTANYGTDPVYGAYGRIQIDAGTTGTYSWVYKRITTTDIRRHYIRVSCWLKLNTGTSAIVQMTRGLGAGTLITITNTWQRFSFDFVVPAGSNGDIGIGFNVFPPSNTDRVADLLIAMNDTYGPQSEDLTDTLPIGNHPYTSPNVNYGWGATGVRYLPQRPSLPYDFDLGGITFFDFFDRADTADGTLGTAPVGSLAWSMRGAYVGGPMPNISLGRISSKMLVVDPPSTTGPPALAVYATQQLRGTVRRIGAVLSYIANTGSNQGANGYVWALAIGPSDPIVQGMIHFIGTHISWSFELWLPSGEKVYLASGSFSPQLSYSGKAYYVDALINDAGTSVTITVPGTRVTVDDARIAQVLGPWCFWEHYILGPSANRLRYHAVWASEGGQSAVSAVDYAKWQPRPIYPSLRPLPALTQAVTYSTDFSNAAWTKTAATISAQASETQKLEGQQVWKLLETTADSAHGISQATGIGAAVQTAVAIVKAKERTRVRLRINNGTDGDVATAIFDITPYETPAVVSGAGAIDDTMRDGVCILSVTGTPTVTGSVMHLELVSTGTTTSYVGSATSGMLVYYAGAEPGTRFTGPIVTAGTSAARATDVPSLGATALGSNWALKLELLVPDGGPVDGEILAGTGEAGGVALLRATADGKLQAYNGTTSLETATGLLAAGRHKVIVRRAGADGAIFVDGVKRVDSTFDFSLPGSPVVALGALVSGASQGSIRVLRSRLFARTVSDTACVALTA